MHYNAEKLFRDLESFDYLCPKTKIGITARVNDLTDFPIRSALLLAP